MGEHSSWFSIIRNGRLYFNLKQDNQIALWSRPTDGGAEAPLTGMPMLDAAENWTATARGIYYTSSTSNPATVNSTILPLQERNVFFLCRNGPPGGDSPISPDGRWLLYTQTDDAQSDIMLAEHFR